MNYMKDKRFASYFQKKLANKARARNPIGTDYNRSQQQVNAMLGRKFNQGQGGAPRAQNSAQAQGSVLQEATRNRQNEQRFRKETKAAKNERAKDNSIGQRLFGKVGDE